MVIETRLHPRIPADWHASIKTLEGSIEVKTKDISVGGACITCPVGYEFEERFSFFLKPPRAKSIRVVAETVWSDKSDPENRMMYKVGVRFLALSPEDQKFIETFVEKEK